MKTRELIEKLQELDPSGETEIVIDWSRCDYYHWDSRISISKTKVHKINKEKTAYQNHPYIDTTETEAITLE